MSFDKTKQVDGDKKDIEQPEPTRGDGDAPAPRARLNDIVLDAATDDKGTSRDRSRSPRWESSEVKRQVNLQSGEVGAQPSKDSQAQPEDDLSAPERKAVRTLIKRRDST